jgi:glycosyltransferase involved in cell wall biosynthesis
MAAILIPMRVLQVTSTAERRGAEVFAHQLGSLLERRGHEVTTVALQRPQHNGVTLPFEVIGPPIGPAVAATAALARRLRSHDVALAHGGSTLMPVHLAARLARRPFVYRNIGDPTHWGALTGARWRVGVPLRNASRVVALYPEAAHYLARTYRLDPTRMDVASNAVEASEFPQRTVEERGEERRRIGLGAEDGPVIGYLGSLSEEKRPEWMLEVAHALPHARVLVAGDGPMRAGLESDAVSRSLDGIRFLGSVAEPRRFLTALDLVALPSRTEGVPGVLIEAALVGVPVVATAVGGVPSVLHDTRAGVAVDPDDAEGFVEAIRSVLEDPNAIRADRATTVRHHDIEAVADDWSSTLQRAISR